MALYSLQSRSRFATCTRKNSPRSAIISAAAGICMGSADAVLIPCTSRSRAIRAGSKLTFKTRLCSDLAAESLATSICMSHLSKGCLSFASDKPDTCAHQSPITLISYSARALSKVSKGPLMPIMRSFVAMLPKALSRSIGPKTRCRRELAQASAPAIGDACLAMAGRALPALNTADTSAISSLNAERRAGIDRARSSAMTGRSRRLLSKLSSTANACIVVLQLPSA
mmetsp:Transcript_7133/g.20901  ORF Transcript_7133/g.20901 Transcript_7133/m.20901 type:complete len:227 (-) Transcript_7133:1205-1885(-)